MASEKIKRDASDAAQAVIDRHVCEGKETGIQVVAYLLCDVALWIQVERGLIELDAPVARYCLECAQNGKGQIKVRHVLLHRSGVPHMPDGTTPQTIADWEWVTWGIAALAPLFPANSRSAYQCISQGFMLGEVIRRTDARKRSYRQFLIDEIATPLGAPDLHHGIPEAVVPRVAIMNEPESRTSGRMTRCT